MPYLILSLDSFNAREAGNHVANEILKTQLHITPLVESDANLQPPFDLKEFEDPKIVEFSLPGGMQYFRSSAPDKYLISHPSESIRSFTTRCVDPENVFVLKVSFSVLFFLCQI